MTMILAWLKRIIQIGILEFLARIGWRTMGTIVLGVVGLIGLLIVVTLILIALLF